MKLFSFTSVGRALLLTAAVIAMLVGTAMAQHMQKGTFTDSRDGQTYKTVVIYSQIWMAQNLNYKPKKGDAFCYDGKEANCKKYGRLYDWETANTACPKGWKLPSKQDWGELVTAIGYGMADVKLKSRSGWIKDGGGDDTFGFSALPGGYITTGSMTGGICDGIGEMGGWWTATEGEFGHYYWDMRYNSRGVDENNEGLDLDDDAAGHSVRCIKGNVR